MPLDAGIGSQNTGIECSSGDVDGFKWISHVSAKGILYDFVVSRNRVGFVSQNNHMVPDRGVWRVQTWDE